MRRLFSLAMILGCSSVEIGPPAPEGDAGIVDAGEDVTDASCTPRQDNDPEVCATNHCAHPVYCGVAIFCDTKCDTIISPATCGYPTDEPACVPCDVRPDLDALCTSGAHAYACQWSFAPGCTPLMMLADGHFVSCCT